MYYLQKQPQADAIHFTVDQEQLVADGLKKKATLQDKETSMLSSLPSGRSGSVKPLVDSSALGQVEDK